MYCCVCSAGMAAPPHDQDLVRTQCDEEVERLLDESADEDRALLEEFSGTLADGL